MSTSNLELDETVHKHSTLRKAIKKELHQLQNVIVDKVNEAKKREQPIDISKVFTIAFEKVFDKEMIDT